MSTPTRGTHLQPPLGFFTAHCSNWVGVQFLLVLAAVLLGKLGWAAEQLSTQAPDFHSQIEPILKEHCWSCHSADNQEGDLRLDRLASMRGGGSSGEPAVVPHQPDGSYLLKMVSGDVPGKQMPPDEPLSSQHIALLRQWIESGAGTPTSYGPPEVSEPLDHWSFRLLPADYRFASIDGFLQDALHQKNLESSPRADRLTLIRRLHLVMLGLPPANEVVSDFLEDSSQDVWKRYVEATLSDSRFGESFASLWLDVVRFGETDGFETNRERPSAWPYRDWVIQAFNQDMPFDQFAKFQIAGDVLGQPAATGFLVAGPHDIVKGQDQKLGLMQRMNELDDMINATGTAFLGLTLGCARCHNHKFDPISQRDYYALQAVFAGVEHGPSKLALPAREQDRLKTLEDQIASVESQFRLLQGKASRAAVSPLRNIEQFSPRPARWVRMTIHATNGGEPCIDEFEIYSQGKNVALSSLGAKSASSGDFQHPYHRLEHVNDGVYGNKHSWIASQVSGGWIEFELPETLEIERIEWARDRHGEYKDRLPVQYDIKSATAPNEWQLLSSSADREPFSESVSSQLDLAALPPEHAHEGKKLLARWNELRQARESLRARLEVWAGQFRQPGTTYRLYRGEPEHPREPVEPGGPSAFVSLPLDSTTPEAERRLGLASWIASPDNPLTARVIVNRIWQFHFGVGLVDTPNDFGQNGSIPSHPELLDWLASQLIQSGWSLKHIHRLILMSEAWQQDSRPREQALAVDADSRFLWRFPPRRLSADGIRDSILAVSGSLDLDNPGGPGFSVFEVELENVRHYHPKSEYGPSEWRRAIYMTRVRQEKDEVFGAFDCPDYSMSVPARSRSMTPIQALNLLNGRFVLQQAERLAARIDRPNEPGEQKIKLAWKLCFQREPTDWELETSLEFAQQHGWLQFCRALLNSNELVFIP